MKQYTNSKEKNSVIKAPDTPLQTVFEECFKEVFELVYERASIDAPIRQFQNILTDMENIRQTSPVAYETIHCLMTCYPITYQEIAVKRGISRSSVFQTLKRLASRYEWVAQIMKAQAKRNQAPPAPKVNKRKGTSRRSF